MKPMKTILTSRKLLMSIGTISDWVESNSVPPRFSMCPGFPYGSRAGLACRARSFFWFSEVGALNGMVKGNTY